MTSVAVGPPDSVAPDATTDIEVIAEGDDVGAARAIVVASLRCRRRAEHDEMWAQLLIEDVFADLVHVGEVDGATHADEAFFVARLRIPEYEIDGRLHRATVRFVRTVSRILPRGTGEQLQPAETEHVAEAGVEFTASNKRYEVIKSRR